MQKEKIDRINELAGKAKITPLSEEELAERNLLRKEYIASCKANFTTTLDNVYILDEEGREKKLAKKP